MERSASPTRPTHPNIGVIGLGIIGRAIAANLRGKGFPVFVWNRSPRPVPNFVGSPGEVAELCNYIQIFVSDDEALLQTVEQLSESLTSRHVVLAHSTVSPDGMRAAAEVVERRGARFVEASFTGSKPAAEKGELIYYVGATEAALDEARPILEASSKKIIYIGSVGQASAIKIATNIITAATVQAGAEALALVHAQGLAPEKFIEAMAANASQSGTLAMKLPKMLDGNFEPQFSIKHMLKDMQLASQLAMSNYLDLGVTSAARDQLLEQMQWGHGDHDYSAVARKYLPDRGAVYEEPHGEEQANESGGGEPTTGSADSETEHLQGYEPVVTATEQPLLSFSGAGQATTGPATRLRRGFLKQLLSRFSSGQE